MIALLLLAAGCPSGEVIDWRFAEQGAPEGVFLSAWGASGDDVWVVGGQPDRGAVLRGAGTSFAPIDLPPGVPLLTWVHGTSADDVWVAGIEGTVLHWDGDDWNDRSLDTDQALWGIHARPGAVRAVGGQSSWGGDAAVAAEWDGTAWTFLDLPPELDELSSLFKVTWDGDAWWVVGAGGVALTGSPLQTVGTGFAQDLVTVDASGGPLVVVGGRGTGAVLERAGEGLAVTAQARAGLQGVDVIDAERALVCGENGLTGLYDVAGDALVEVPPLTTDVLHGCFVAPDGRPYAVGGNLFTSGDTFMGTILAGRPLE